MSSSAYDVSIQMQLETIILAPEEKVVLNPQAVQPDHAESLPENHGKGS